MTEEEYDNYYTSYASPSTYHFIDFKKRWVASVKGGLRWGNCLRHVCRTVSHSNLFSFHLHASLFPFQGPEEGHSGRNQERQSWAQQEKVSCQCKRGAQMGELSSSCMPNSKPQQSVLFSFTCFTFFPFQGPEEGHSGRNQEKQSWAQQEKVSCQCKKGAQMGELSSSCMPNSKPQQSVLFSFTCFTFFPFQGPEEGHSGRNQEKQSWAQQEKVSCQCKKGAQMGELSSSCMPNSKPQQSVLFSFTCFTFFPFQGPEEGHSGRNQEKQSWAQQEKVSCQCKKGAQMGELSSSCMQISTPQQSVLFSFTCFSFSLPGPRRAIPPMQIHKRVEWMRRLDKIVKVSRQQAQATVGMILQGHMSATQQLGHYYSKWVTRRNRSTVQSPGPRRESVCAMASTKLLRSEYLFTPKLTPIIGNVFFHIYILIGTCKYGIVNSISSGFIKR